jgi:4-hydroxy-tetrahydrodipicolinate synthase
MVVRLAPSRTSLRSAGCRTTDACCNPARARRREANEFRPGAKISRVRRRRYPPIGWRLPGEGTLLTLIDVAASFRPSRLLVPLVTPFDADGHVDQQALERLAGDVLSAGAAGLVALGTTAEPTSLDEGERAAVVAVCARACAEHRAALVVAAGTNDTRTTIERHVALADVPGVRAALTVVPYYVRPSEAAIVAHFQAVATRSPVPLIVYNIPYRTGRGLGSAAVLELASTDNIVGLKQAVGGIDTDTLEVLAHAPAGFGVLGGDDAFLYPLVLMGGSGAIAASANLVTHLFAEMLDEGLAGRVAAGRRLAETLLPVVVALFAEPSPAVIKAVLHAQGRIATGDVRMPLASSSRGAAGSAVAALRALESVHREAPLARSRS